MKKEVYFCDICEEEKYKNELIKLNCSLKKLSSDTITTSFNTEICIECLIKGNNGSKINLNMDFMKMISLHHNEMI